MFYFRKFYENFKPVPDDDTKKPEPFFGDAIETLQQLKTTFAPLEKLMVLKNTNERISYVKKLL